MKKSFTLVEVLVVVGIIAILAAGMIPVLTGMKDRGSVNPSIAIRVGTKTVNYKIVPVEGCQYIATDEGAFIHKANCTNEVHLK